MNYLSVCSGIEAATVGWHSLGWKPVAFSEIEKFPCSVLVHHYPDVPNWGDMTKMKEWPDANVNVLVGGTPCQSFSVAGLRKGLADPRGNLMLTYLAIAAKYSPEWLVWENVPGVLSSNGGRDFASLLRGMGQLGYGFAYRILDAQYFGVPQRRRRVFVVGCLGGWQRAAAVLFERHSLQRHTAPRRKAREGVASTVTASLGTGGADYDTKELIGGIDYENNGHGPNDPTGPLLKGSPTGGGRPLPAIVQAHRMVAFGEYVNADCPMFVPTKAFYESSLAQYREDDIARTTKASGGVAGGGSETFIAQPIALQDVRAVEKMQNGRGWNDDGTAYTVDTYATQGVAQPIPLDMMNIRGRPSDDGRANRIGRGYGEVGDPMFTITKANHHAVAQPISFSGQMSNPQTDVDMTQTLQAKNPMEVAQPVGAFKPGQSASAHSIGYEIEMAPTLEAGEGGNKPAVHVGMAVRRLTPKECERLQGFPDDYTQVPYHNKPAADGTRYKALGNSMAVPVMAWIGKRIQQVEEITCTTKQKYHFQ